MQERCLCGGFMATRYERNEDFPGGLSAPVKKIQVIPIHAAEAGTAQETGAAPHGGVSGRVGRTGMEETKIVLCGASAYEQKYYFNERFNGIPESVKEELHIICVLFTEEVGGVFTIAFEEDGNVVLETEAEEEDIYYDEVGSGLLVGEVRRNRQDLFEALRLYYRIFILKENIPDLLKEDSINDSGD